MYGSSSTSNMKSNSNVCTASDSRFQNKLSRSVSVDGVRTCGNVGMINWRKLHTATTEQINVGMINRRTLHTAMTRKINVGMINGRTLHTVMRGQTCSTDTDIIYTDVYNRNIIVPSNRIR